MSTATTSWLDLDVPGRVVFTNSPLVLTVCQVRFSPILGVSNPTVVAPFQQAIIDQYPVASHAQDQNVQVHVEGSPGGNQASVQSSLGSITWRFTDFENTWTVVLTPEFLTLETRGYGDFSEFEDRLERLLGALDKTIHPTVGLRIGLRYVNEIRPAGGDWRTAIRPDLLGALALPPFGDTAVQSFQQLLFRQPDGVRVNLHHGLFPNGSVVDPRPGQMATDGPFYLIDIDVYQEFKPGELSMKPRAVRDYVRKYHEFVSTLFRWSVTEDYTASLERV
jgi:uncharacterized protein (TIGR04255 family)